MHDGYVVWAGITLMLQILPWNGSLLVCCLLCPEDRLPELGRCLRVVVVVVVWISILVVVDVRLACWISAWAVICALIT